MTQALSLALLHFVWQGVAVASLLWMALFLLRKRSANVRYLASCAALAVLAALPVATTAYLYRPSIAVPAVSDVQLIISTLGTTSAPITWLSRMQSWALPIWSLGVLLFSMRFIWGWGQVSAIRRHGQPADESVLAMVAGLGVRMGVARPLRVLISSIAEGPSVVGWIRPVILLPAATVLGLTPEQLEAVLAHELAHIRRYDYLVNILQMLVETVLFYHPAVWWTSSRIRHERELCCDDAAVRSCGDALCYARALTTLEKLRASPSMAVASTGGSMLYRIERLVGKSNEEYTPSRWPGVVAICLGLAVFALNTNWASGQAQPPRPPQPAQVPPPALIAEIPEVAIAANGTVTIGGTRVNLNQIGKEVKSKYPGAKEVYVNASRETTWETVAKTLVEIGKSGLSIKAVTKAPDPGPTAKEQPLAIAELLPHDNQPADLAKATVQFLEQQLSEMRKRYTDSYPDMQVLIQKLDAAKKAAAMEDRYQQAVRSYFQALGGQQGTTIQEAQTALQNAVVRVDSAKKVLALREQALADEQKKLAIGASGPDEIRQRQIELENARQASAAAEEAAAFPQQQLYRLLQGQNADAERQRQRELENLERLREAVGASQQQQESSARTQQRNLAEQSAQLAEMQRSLLDTESQLKAHEAQLKAQMAELQALMEALKAQKDQQK